MTQILPLLPLRDIVVFPHMVVPLFVGRDGSVAALEKAMEVDKRIVLAAQKDAATDEPKLDDLYPVGVTATIVQLLKTPDGTVRVLVEGAERVRLVDLTTSDGLVEASFEGLEETATDSTEAEAYARQLTEQFDAYAKQSKKLSSEVVQQLGELDDRGHLADMIAANLQIKVAEKQTLLAELDVLKRMEALLGLMDGEIGVIQVEKKIRGRVKRQMEKSQREYYLNEQMKAIQRELGGEGEDGDSDEIDELTAKITKLKLSKEARAKATSELKKLKGMGAHVCRVDSHPQLLGCAARTAVGQEGST